MDTQYLKSTVGPVLAEGLAFIASQQPEDPIECLANYLRKHSANTVAKEQVSHIAVVTVRDACRLRLRLVQH